MTHTFLLKRPITLLNSALLLLLTAPQPIVFAQTLNTGNPTLTLQRVSLSSSGVGYFEYEAQVTGNAMLRLPVALDKVDDVLKSLVIYDNQGKIGGISLPGLDPIAHTLKQLPFDPSAFQTPAALLEALRGAEISVGGNNQTALRGRIVSVHAIAAANKAPTKHQVTIMSAQGMQQFILETAENLQFEDLTLREQIQNALIALSNNRAKDNRTLSIISEGEGTRTVRMGYVTTSPIWKNAYRISLPSSSAESNNSQIQGWAILENMSGQDWRDVQLTLTAGKPVAFSQKLYTSYYNKRPHVAVELPGNIVPQVDNGTFKANEIAAPATAAPMPMAMMAAAPMSKMARSAGSAADNLSAPTFEAAELASAADAATTNNASTQASYTFNLPVSVGNGQSLSIPIIQAALPIKRVALYQPSVNRQFPLAAIELKNTTHNTLPAGAVTLYEATASGTQFVGDAQLTVLPPDDTRYISYALDQKLSVSHTTQDNNWAKRYSVKTGGILHTDYVYGVTHSFTVKSAHMDTHDLIVEVPIQAGNWTLNDTPNHVDAGKTNTHYRRKITVKPKETVTADIKQTYLTTATQALDDLDTTALQEVLKNINKSELAAKDKPIIERVLVLVKARDALLELINTANDALSVGRENQKRIRDNIKSVPAKTEPHNRYIAELNKADEQDARLQSELKALTAQQTAQKTALQHYLNSIE